MIALARFLYSYYGRRWALKHAIDWLLLCLFHNLRSLAFFSFFAYEPSMVYAYISIIFPFNLNIQSYIAFFRVIGRESLTNPTFGIPHPILHNPISANFFNSPCFFNYSQFFFFQLLFMSPQFHYIQLAMLFPNYLLDYPSLSFFNWSPAGGGRDL